MAVVRSTDLYKVPATGKMTSANVVRTCEAVDMRAVCINTKYQDSKCTCVQNDIFHRMAEIICSEQQKAGKEFYHCKQLQNIFVYMKKRGSFGEGGYESYGVVNQLVVTGNEFSNKFALCVK